MLHPLLQQMFKITSLSMDTSRELSSPFISHLINNCLLYHRGSSKGKEGGIAGPPPQSEVCPPTGPTSEIFGECNWTSSSHCKLFYVKNCLFVHMANNFSGDWPLFGDPSPDDRTVMIVLTTYKHLLLNNRIQQRLVEQAARTHTHTHTRYDGATNDETTIRRRRHTKTRRITGLQ